eukprot:768813-Hanusia_phi.AAC.2
MPKYWVNRSLQANTSHEALVREYSLTSLDALKSTLTYTCKLNTIGDKLYARALLNLVVLELILTRRSKFIKLSATNRTLEQLSCHPRHSIFVQVVMCFNVLDRCSCPQDLIFDMHRLAVQETAFVHTSSVDLWARNVLLNRLLANSKDLAHAQQDLKLNSRASWEEAVNEFVEKCRTCVRETSIARELIVDAQRDEDSRDEDDDNSENDDGDGDGDVAADDDDEGEGEGEGEGEDRIDMMMVFVYRYYVLDDAVFVLRPVI